MSEGLTIAVIGLLASGVAGVWAWIRSRRKVTVEVEAQRQAALSERFDDANALAEYIKKQVAEEIKPWMDKAESHRAQLDSIYTGFRNFYTRLWVWDRDGRHGPLPMVSAELLEDLRLAHLLELPFEDTEPYRKKES